MKTHSIASLLAVATLVAVNVVAPARAGIISKADNNNALNLGTSWVGGTAPRTNDVATWNSALATASRTTSLGADVAWNGIAISLDPGGNLVFNAGNTLTLGAAGFESTPNRSVSFNNAILLGADQTWNVVAQNYVIPLGTVNTAGYTLTLAGGGTKQFKNSITGAGDIVVVGGTLQMTSPTGFFAAAPDSAITLEPGTTLWFDVKRGNSNVRAASVDVVGGTLQTKGDTLSGGVAQKDFISGDLTVSAGSIVQVQTGNTSSYAQLFANRLVHGANPSILFRGTNLGSNTITSISANTASIAFTNAPALTGSGGSAGTPTVSILPNAYGDVAYSGTGTGLVTYDTTYGVRLLNFGTEYTPAVGDGESAGNNVRLVNVSGGQILTNALTSALTVVNSLSLDVTGPHGNAGIRLLGDEDAVLRLTSGTVFARESGIASTNDDATDITSIGVPLDFDGNQGLILNARTDGMSDGSGPALSFNVSPVNDGGNGILFGGAGSSYLQWPAPTGFTGPVIINSGWLRITGSGNTAVIPTKLVLNGGSVQDHGNRIADSADIEIHPGSSLLIKGGATNSGDSGSEDFRDLTMKGGSFTLGGGGGGICTNRSATLLGGTMSLQRGTLTTVTKDMVVAGCKVTLSSNGDSNRAGTRLVVVGALTVSNTVDTVPYVPFNMGYSWYRNPAYLSVTNKVSVYGNDINTNGVAVTRTYDADPRTMLAEIRLNGAVEVFIDDGAAEYDFDVDASFANNGGVRGALVKTGDGTLRMTASANCLSNGIQVAAGRLVLDGGVSNNVSVAAAAKLAGNGGIEGSLALADGAIFQHRMLDGTTSETLEVSGAVTGTGTVVVEVPQDQPEGEWLVLTAASIAPTFVSTDPAWTLRKRNGDTELWLGPPPTLLIIR